MDELELLFANNQSNKIMDFNFRFYFYNIIWCRASAQYDYTFFEYLNQFNYALLILGGAGMFDYGKGDAVDSWPIFWVMYVLLI